MSTFYDLPNEIMMVLKHYLDIESVVQLSRTCVRYEDLFKYNSSIRVVNFRNSFNDNFTFDDMAYYLTNNNIHIVSLNISYVKILEAKKFKEIILHIGTLKHLTLIETGINIKGLSPVINRNKSIISVDVTGNDLDFPTIRRGLKTMRIFLNILHLPVDVPEVKSLRAIEHLEFIDTLDHNIYWEYGSINLSENQIISFKSLYQATSMLQMDVFLSRNIRAFYHYVLEFYDGFHLSPQLEKEFDGIPRENRIDSVTVDSRTRYNIKGFYLCNKIHQEGVYERYKEIINQVARDTAKNLIYVHSPEKCPIKDNTVLEKRSNADMYKYITLQDCCLSFTPDDEASTSTSDKICFKKPRLSRIQNEDCVMKEIAENFKKIEVIDICNKNGHAAKINTGFFDSLKLFQNLKSLSLFNLPYFNYEGLKNAFESCVFLETLIYISYEENLPMSRWLSKNLVLCKRIKTIVLELHTDDINIFLKPIADCRALLYLDVMYPNINKKMITNPFFFDFESMVRFIEKTKVLKYFSIVPGAEEFIVNRVNVNSRKVEKDLTKKFPFININLTKCKYFMKRCEFVNTFFNPCNV